MVKSITKWKGIEKKNVFIIVSNLFKAIYAKGKTTFPFWN